MKLALAEFPGVSVAVHTTAVSPIGNMLPDGGVHVSDATASSVSLAETE